MPCSNASFNNKEKFATTKEENESHEVLHIMKSKKLLQLYYENIGQIGHFPHIQR